MRALRLAVLILSLAFVSSLPADANLMPDGAHWVELCVKIANFLIEKTET